jgi:hypothetical protein
MPTTIHGDINTLAHPVTTTCSIPEKEQILETIKVAIEKLNKIQHIEILNILNKNPLIKLNENRNGVLVNMSYLPDETIDELNKYLDYVKDQENSLEQIETQKEEFKSAFFLSTR